MALSWQLVLEGHIICLLAAVLVVCSYKQVLPFFISDVQETPRLVKSAFALTIGTSFMVFFLVLCEFGQWIPLIRSLAWHVSIWTLLALLIAILPLFLDYTYFSEAAGGTSRYRHCCMALAFGAQLYFFYRIGDFIPQGNSTPQTFLAACVLRVGFLGISSMALVSGFGAVSALWSVFHHKRIVSDFEVVRLRQSISMAHEQIQAKARLLEKLEVRHAQDESILARLIGSSSMSNEFDVVQNDLSHMHDLHNELIADLTSTQAALDEQLRSQTAMGICLKSFDILFSLYCIYRILATVYNLTPWKQTTSIDPVSRFLALLVTHYGEFDKERMVRLVGFLLSGMVIVGSLRACLLVLAKISKILPRLINQQSMALLFACLMGSYNVATAIVLCRSLPSAYGRNILSNLGTSLDQSRFDIWFDSVFLIGVLVTGLTLFFQRKLSGLDLTDATIESEKSV